MADLPARREKHGMTRWEPLRAQLKEGVLSVRVPKPAQAQPRRIEIKSG